MKIVYLRETCAGLDKIYNAVTTERIRQDEKWGQQDHPIFPDTWSLNIGRNAAEAWKELCDSATKQNRQSWYYILMEEVAEVFAEDNFQKQKEELIHVMAVAASMIQCLDRNVIKEE